MTHHSGVCMGGASGEQAYPSRWGADRERGREHVWMSASMGSQGQCISRSYEGISV